MDFDGLRRRRNFDPWQLPRRLPINMYQKLTLTQSISMLTVLSGAFAAEPVVHEILLILYWRHHQLHHRLEDPRRWLRRRQKDPLLNQDKLLKQRLKQMQPEMELDVLMTV